MTPRDLILQGTWHYALFTTYSLSLSFFESQLWRGALKKKGCREAWIIADIDGYSESLGERQSRFVGHEYRLVPVALPRGVFHPKCSYLSGPDGDVLLVGSGNLTFGGHGRNIEVLEVFRSLEHPGIFEEFADFLAALRARADFLNPESAWLDQFERLARHAARRPTPASSTTPPRLLHSTTRGILDQLADIAQPFGEVTEARILSPYFDPKAEAVNTLAQRLKIPRLKIGLPPKNGEKSTFPFDRPLTGLRIEAASIGVETSSRKLHAKWLELDFADKRRLTLTGSVNATRQALCSSNNIEVGVIRSSTGPESYSLKWTKSPTPSEIERPDFTAPGLGARALLHARLTEDGRVLGRLLGSFDVSAAWQACLGLPDGNSLLFAVTLQRDGSFAHRLPSGSPYEGEPGLQLHLQQGRIHARCWVQNDWLIELAQLGARHAAPLIALFRGDSDDEDEVAFLTFLHDGIAQLAPAMAEYHSALAPARPESQPTETPAHVVPVSALKPANDEHDFEEDDTQPPSTSNRNERLAEVLDRLLHEFEERPASAPVSSRPTSAESEDLSDEDAVAETEELETARLQSKAHDAALFRLRDTVRAYLHDEQTASAKRAACFLWLQVELRTHLRNSPSDPAPALAFLRAWFLQTARHCRWQALNDSLDERVWLVACALGLQALPEELVGLHEGLEDYQHGEPHPELLATVPRVPPAFTGLVPAGADLLSGIGAIRAARTRRQEIGLLRKCAATNPPTPPPAGLSVCLHGAGKEAHRRLAARQRVEICELLPGRSACPHPSCRMTISHTSLETLRLQRIVACVHCERIVIDLAPRS